MKKFLYLCLGLACVACSEDTPEKPNEKPDIPRSEFTKDAEIVNYYKAQLDQADIKNPNEKMYREFIAVADIASEREQMWQLWQDANKERVQQSKMTEELIMERGKSDYWGEMQYLGLETVWDIPQDEKMKLKMFFKGEKPATSYPMIINLHGGGEYPDAKDAWGSSINTDEYMAMIEISRGYQDSPAFYFVPRMADDRKGNWHYMPQVQTFKKAMQIAMLTNIANPKKLYLTGISQGGYGTLSLAQFMPDYFAAVGVMAAADAFDATAQNLRNLAFRMKVGSKDYEYGRVNYAYIWEEQMKKLQAENPNDFVGEVVIEQGKDHKGIDYDDMTPWLKKHERRVYPEHLSYVYHNVAQGKGVLGMYSNGVYYLDFRRLTRDSDKAQALFEVKHTGNTYDVTVKQISGKIGGKLALYLDKVDFEKPIVVRLNGKEVYSEKQRPSRGVLAESIALWGDALRIFSAKISIEI